MHCYTIWPKVPKTLVRVLVLDWWRQKKILMTQIIWTCWKQRALRITCKSLFDRWSFVITQKKTLHYEVVRQTHWNCFKVVEAYRMQNIHANWVVFYFQIFAELVSMPTKWFSNKTIKHPPKGFKLWIKISK